MADSEPIGTPSPLFLARADALRAAARAGPIVDLACGRGRHALPAAKLAARVVGIDRNLAHLRELAERCSPSTQERMGLLQADLECGHQIPLRARSCAVVLVFRYLHRPITSQIAELLAPGGLLLYETYTVEQRELGFGPRSDAFLLQPGELRGLFPTLEILESSEGIRDGARPEATARLLARAPLV